MTLIEIIFSETAFWLDAEYGTSILCVRSELRRVESKLIK